MTNKSGLVNSADTCSNSRRIPGSNQTEGLAVWGLHVLLVSASALVVCVCALEWAGDLSQVLEIGTNYNKRWKCDQGGSSCKPVSD